MMLAVNSFQIKGMASSWVMAYSDGAVPYGAALFGTARPRGGITRLRGRVAPSTSSGRSLGSATVLGRYLGYLGLPSVVRDGQLLSCYAAENFGFSGLNRADRNAAGELCGDRQPGGGVRAGVESADRRNRGGKVNPGGCAGVVVGRQSFERRDSRWDRACYGIGAL